MSRRPQRYIALTGGVGGAKLCLGLASILEPDEVTFVVNTADDFEHLGLHVSPDLDTLTYTLAGLSNRDTGWGRAGETWHFIEALQALGGETWFKLGDTDLATHVRRTQLLRAGLGLTEITAVMTAALGVRHTILPMSDDAVRTVVHTADGRLAFQHYFVRERCEPSVTHFEFAGIGQARINPAIETALRDPALAGVIICPSNPYVSVDPILSLPGFVTAMRAAQVPVIAVSPIIGGEAVKGPTAKMMRELSVPATATAVARHYRDKIDGFIIDRRDAAAAPDIALLGIETTVAETLMVSLGDRTDLARAVTEFASRLKHGN